MRVKKTVFPVLAAWSLGAVCFGFFLETLEPPTPPRVVETAPPPEPPETASTQLADPPPPVIELDPVVIVGHAGPVGASRDAPDEGWVCDTWRPLVQGDVTQQVRLCRTAREGD